MRGGRCPGLSAQHGAFRGRAPQPCPLLWATVPTAQRAGRPPSTSVVGHTARALSLVLRVHNRHGHTVPATADMARTAGAPCVPLGTTAAPPPRGRSRSGWGRRGPEEGERGPRWGEAGAGAHKAAEGGHGTPVLTSPAGSWPRLAGGSQQPCRCPWSMPGQMPGDREAHAMPRCVTPSPRVPAAVQAGDQ